MINALRKIFWFAISTTAIMLPMLFLFSFWSMSGSHTYYQQAQVYLDGAKEVLITHGLCESKNDCNRRHILFGDGGATKLGPFKFGGVQIQVYEVSDPEVIGDIVKAFGEIYKKQKGPRLKMNVYKTKHLESKIEFANVLIE